MKIDATTPRQYILRLNHHPPDYRLQIQPFTAKNKPINQTQPINLSRTPSKVHNGYKSLIEKVQLRKMSQVSSSQHYDPTNFAQSNTMSIDTKQFHIFTQKNSRANTCIQQLSYTYDPIINHQKQKNLNNLKLPLRETQEYCLDIFHYLLQFLLVHQQQHRVGVLQMGRMDHFWLVSMKIQMLNSIHHQNYDMFLSLKFVSLISLDLDNTYFTVPEAAENVGGTSAQLQTGDQLNLRDLLYGLMLPSGNDAAVTLKHNFEQTTGINFIDEMNSCAKEFGLKSTQYMNPHGLYHKFNYSSALDIGILCFQALQNEHFANIVKTKIYFSEIIDKFGNIKEILWENTNKLLDNGFQGVKTGQTKEAGPCVVEYYLDNNNSYIIVLLNCKSTDYRWYDAIQLLDWIKQ